LGQAYGYQQGCYNQGCTNEHPALLFPAFEFWAGDVHQQYDAITMPMVDICDR
jgi:hypothetical protein